MISDLNIFNLIHSIPFSALIVTVVTSQEEGVPTAAIIQSCYIDERRLGKQIS